MKTPRFVLALLGGAMLASAGYAADAPKTKYFPESGKRHDVDGAISSFTSEWYSKHLDAMSEPALYPAKPGVTAYRLLILPTWGNPIAVRAELHDGVYRLTSVRLDGQGGYEPGKVAARREVTLSVDDTRQLSALVAALRFFNQPTDDDAGGADGDQWILEGVAAGRYHLLDRWCAAQDVERRKLGPFLAVCRFLVDHSKLDKRPQNRGRDILPTE